jgi:lipopolysaccharide transport system permease protein
MAMDQLERGLVARPRPGSPSVRVIAPRRTDFVGALRELWAYRWYTYFFGRRILARRYMRTWLGVVWLPLRPAMNIGARLLVFGGVIGITSHGTPYPVFFVSATAAWQLFSECALWSTRSLDLNRDILRTFEVPRLVVVAGAVVPSVVDFLISAFFAGVALTVYLVTRHTFYLNLTWSSLVEVPLALVLIVLIGIGIGLITAASTARARDVRFGLMYALGFVYYLTPVIYPYSAIPNSYKRLAELNPVTGALQMFKVGLFHQEGLAPKALAVSIATVVILWVPGLWLFHRNDARDA